MLCSRFLRVATAKTGLPVPMDRGMFDLLRDAYALDPASGASLPPGHARVLCGRPLGQPVYVYRLVPKGFIPETGQDTANVNCGGPGHVLR